MSCVTSQKLADQLSTNKAQLISNFSKHRHKKVDKWYNHEPLGWRLLSTILLTKIRSYPINSWSDRAKHIYISIESLTFKNGIIISNFVTAIYGIIYAIGPGLGYGILKMIAANLTIINKRLQLWLIPFEWGAKQCAQKLTNYRSWPKFAGWLYP